MNAPPLDYAPDEGAAFGNARAAAEVPADVTLAALLDRHAAALPVTDVMIRNAWRRLEARQGSTLAAADAPPTGPRLVADIGGPVERTLRLSRLLHTEA